MDITFFCLLFFTHLFVLFFFFYLDTLCVFFTLFLIFFFQAASFDLNFLISSLPQRDMNSMET